MHYYYFCRMKPYILPLICILCAISTAHVSGSTPLEISGKAMEGYRLFTRDSLPDDRRTGYGMMLDAAWEGDAKAANNIGWLNEQGIYVEKDLAAALRWYERASDAGLPAASLNYVGIVFRHPEALQGKAADVKRVAKAAMTAGRALAMGHGLPYDYRQGEELIIRAGLLGDRDAATTIAQQLEMYPDSFSYLPLADIIRECDALLPDGQRLQKNGENAEALADRLLTPEYWYGIATAGQAPLH